MCQPSDRCELEIRVRYPECDPMGYVHHARYFEYFEMGRTEMLRRSGVAYADCEKRGVFFVIAKVNCTFRRPAHYDDVLRVVVRVTRQTRARIDHAYELYRDKTLLCEASSVLACVGTDGKPMMIPEDIIPPADVPTGPAPR